MSAVYASASDLALHGVQLTSQQQQQVDSLLEAASAKLRLIAKKYGCDIDQMISSDEDFAVTVRETVVTCVKRALDSYSSDTAAASQMSQSALGYSISMTYLNAGQSLYYLRNELKDLGILRQRFGALEVYGDENTD